MKGHTTHRFTRLVMILALMGMMAVDVAGLNEAVAAPVQTKLTIRQRIDSNRGDCKAGGGTLTVDRTFSAGPFPILVGATTTCEGGSFDGDTCVHTRTTADCKYGKQSVPGTVARREAPVSVGRGYVSDFEGVSLGSPMKPT